MRVAHTKATEHQRRNKGLGGIIRGSNLLLPTEDRSLYHHDVVPTPEQVTDCSVACFATNPNPSFSLCPSLSSQSLSTYTHSITYLNIFTLSNELSLTYSLTLCLTCCIKSFSSLLLILLSHNLLLF